MRLYMLMSLIVFPVAALAQQCPAGQVPWVDPTGNPMCRDIGSGETHSTQGTLNSCPPNTHGSVDNGGNRVCAGNGQRPSDTSQDCPAGMHPGVDSSGNKTCKGM
jgi:hypothetical protein